MRTKKGYLKSAGSIVFVVGFSVLCSTRSFIPSSNALRNWHVMVSGHFEGELTFNFYDEENKAKFNSYLDVWDISKEEYGAANGVNVVLDLITLKYYGLSFYYLDSESTRHDYTFSNLDDAYHGSYKVPIDYKDDFGTYLSPPFSDVPIDYAIGSNDLSNPFKQIFTAYLIKVEMASI